MIFGIIFSSFATDLTPNIVPSANSATCNNGTLDTFSGTSNLSANWGANTINLHWYADSDATTELSVQNASQSCVYDGTLTPPPVASIPQKTGYTFAGWKVRGLPDEYTKLQYIEGGTAYNAYMDLGFTATPTMQTLLIASVGQVGDQQVLLGAADGGAFSGNKTYAIDVVPSRVYIPNGDYVPATSSVPFTVTPNVVYKFKINYPNVGQIGVDDTIKTGFTNITSVSSQKLLLFGYRYSSNIQTTAFPRKMKVYGLRFWDNGIMLHNFIPAKRKSDNVVGLWDSVTKTFKSGIGSGSLVAGPNAQ